MESGPNSCYDLTMNIGWAYIATAILPLLSAIYQLTRKSSEEDK